MRTKVRATNGAEMRTEVHTTNVGLWSLCTPLRGRALASDFGQRPGIPGEPRL